MSEEALWTLVADPESVLAAFDEIAAGAQEMSDAITEAVSTMDEAFATLGESIGEASAMMADSTAAVGELSASLDELAAGEGAAAEGATELGAAAESTAAQASTLGEAINAAMGPLMMIGMAAGMVGGKLIGMGLDGQKGEALLSGMAGASQADIQALQGEAMKLGISMSDAAAGFYQVESAGYSGSQAITVFDAASRLALGGQMQASDAMSALTAIMHDYSAQAGDATHYTDLMAEAVVRGKQSASDFSRSIGPLASAGENVGLSFQQVAAAEATMTQINPSVMRDSQQLIGLFQSLDPAIGGIAKKAQGLHIAFNETHYASLDLLGKLEYLAQITGGTDTAAFVKLTGGVRGSTAAIDLLKGGASAFKGNLEAMQHATGATANAFGKWEETIPAALDKVGAAFSILGTKLMDAIGPKVTPIIDNIATAVGNFATMISTNIDTITPILVGLAAVITGVLIVALIALVSAIGPVILAIAGFGVAMGALSSLVGFHVSMISNYFDQMHRSAEENTLQMKLKSLQNSKEQAEGTVANILNQEHSIEYAIERTRDAHTRAMLEMKLKALEHSREQAEGVIKNIQHEREGVQHELDQLNPQVQLKNLQRKDDTIGKTIEMTERTIAGYGQMRAGIEASMKETTNDTKRDALERQLAQITAAQKQKEGVLKQLEEQRAGTEKAMAAVRQAMNADQGNLITQALGTFNRDLSATINNVRAAITWLAPILKSVSDVVKSEMMPAWQSLVNLWNTQLKPSFTQLQQAIQPILPLLQGLGALVGGVLILALGGLVGLLNGVIGAISGFVRGLATLIGGIVQTFTGVVQTVSGILRIFKDLFTGNFGDIKAAFGELWQGLINIGTGFSNILIGVVEAPFFAIWGFMSGFITGVIGFFTTLYDKLVGHSIIPDLINEIGRWFGSLPGKALQWGSDLISGFISGIKNMAGNLSSTVSNIAGNIKHLIGFSKPDQGPLADFDKYAPDMIELFAQGIEAHKGRLKEAMTGLASTVSTGINPHTALPAGGGFSPPGGGTSALAPILQQILAVLQQQQGRGGSGNIPPSVTMNNTNHFQGVSSIQQLYQALNQLGGIQFEGGTRGTY